MLNQTEGLQRIVEIVEEDIGEVVSSEEQCPGVYYVACRPVDEAMASELLFVERACPHISAAAKGYGKELPGHEELLMYDFADPCGGRPVVLYEANRYLVRNKLMASDKCDLLSSAVYYADDYPEYFGPIPAPIVTPRGYMTRYITLSSGVFALETSTGERFISLAGIIWYLELQDTTKALGMKVANPCGSEVPVEAEYLFFTEADGCLALFELLQGLSDPADCPRLDLAALMNAIWTYHPDYALSHNLREQQGLNDLLGLLTNSVEAEVELSGSAENMVTLTVEAGVEYVRW